VKDINIKKWIPAVILSIGLLLIGAHLLKDATTYLQTAFISVEHPPTYRFTTYGQILRKYVKDDLVDYKALKSDPLLNKSIDELAHTSPDRMVDERERLTFWINSYNLLVLKSVCDRYPITSVKQLGNTFNSKPYIIGGKSTCIQDIYVGQLLPLLKRVNPEALFLICGGAMGYPALENHVIVPDDLYRDVRYASYKFLNDPRNAYYDKDMQTFLISLLLQWNQDLLAPLNESIHLYVNERLMPGKQYDEGSSGTTTSFFKTFNWRLNDTALANKEIDAQ
jgi:hypothetical protein